jgi:hypothetical protein
MRSPSQVSRFVGVAVAVLALAGCQKVAFDQTSTLDPSGVQTFVIDAPARGQEVTLTVTATSPIDVYIAAEKDVNQAKNDVRAPKTSLASKKGVEKDTLTASIPAKTAYGIVLLGTPKTKAGTSVTVSLRGK